MTTEREKIIQLARDCGADMNGNDPYPRFTFFESTLETFYNKAQAEALRNIKVQVPTNTMEQMFSNYHRLGYNKGMAEAFEDAAKLCDELAANGVFYKDYAEHAFAGDCAAAIREMAKEKQNG